MSRFMFQGAKTKEISFPLGGIGTGCIGLSGNGRLIDWEIFNRPHKRSDNGYTHFAVKAESDGQVLDARILQGDLQPSYMGHHNQQVKRNIGYGFGPLETTLAGMPHFKDTVFTGEFPFAEMTFKDEQFPGDVTMRAFNPFIPLNDRDSSIPGAFFTIEVCNTSNRDITYTINLAMKNPQKEDKNVHSYNYADNIHSIKLGSEELREGDVRYGDMTMATDAEEASYQQYWYRGGWVDGLEVYWKDFASPGRFKNRVYEPAKCDNYGSLAAHVQLKPGERKSVRFVITWNYPNSDFIWPEVCDCNRTSCQHTAERAWKNYYASMFGNSEESAVYALNQWERLYSETAAFKNALFSSSLPPEAMDAVAANLATLKSPTCLRLSDGSFYGYEGCIWNEGSCPGSCTHVWNYAYALPFLFPKLERSMRDLDFTYNQCEDGRMSFRLATPVGRELWSFPHACVDGQFGGVIKAYRDWKISGDTQWLRSHWIAIKKSIEYAWADTNADKWDADRDGVIEGRQHHTLDMELVGPNAWLNGFYLAALKAGAEMAHHLGEPDTAASYMDLYRKGKRWTDKHLFNGEYYGQQVDLKDHALLERYGMTNYWNDEAKEIKYQMQDGCGIDQVIAQWHANLCGLGEIFDREQTKKALSSIYKYNFKNSMRNEVNPWRLYSLNDEGGAMICVWPDSARKPVVPLTYASETMHGFEYQAAAHMIQEGLVREGLDIVRSIRDRYDGEKRNPWNEMECGSHYARSMASYSLLLAFSGFEYDLTKGLLGFNPIEWTDSYQTFWSLDSGWGTFSVHGGEAVLRVEYGNLPLQHLHLPFLRARTVDGVTVNGEDCDMTCNDGLFTFAQKITIERGASLVIRID
ncbi:GH116 family glycosyl-hydrolase [Paenibacillus sp. LHD-38]|uniref:GH116 family glycosyl-hydrolase n=1 Tax=Paenibacillus sp. LHD-38 TaxID=3072143 RepID=UPI0028109A06|nr:GH116 family glycosyl-hydrolase [Paenibacillus sp. LHD-38]MDQ8738775.1 GH116 family glycosyl-hydrolase [Paenibacillus sp. LHD-38]